MKKRLLTGLLCLCLCLALGGISAGAEEELGVTVAPGETVELPAPEEAGEDPGETLPDTPADPKLFVDVPPDAWYATAANLACLKGLMQGTGGGYFSPMQRVTLGEVVTLAARVHAQENGLTVPPAGTGEPWYEPGYQYCIRHQLFTAQDLGLEEMTQEATRFQVVELLDGALPDRQKIPINQVSSWDIPDLAEGDPHGEVVYKWVRAGIVQGDQTGAFGGDRAITRSELATVLCRLTGTIPRVRTTLSG